jgi:acyl dehydratase
MLVPHDKNGKEVKVGDTVTVTAKVLTVQPSEEYCNLGLETVEPMHPSDTKTSLTLNAKQVEKQG